MRLSVLRSLLAAMVALFAASCSAPANAPAPAPTKLPAVEALPRPSLPPWIASISPTGTADGLAQVRVIFSKPVTKLEALSGDGPRDVLDHVTVDPPLKGHFTVLTPRMIGFVAEQALPLGTRVRVTLTSGLRDLNGDTLDHDLAWTFATKPIEFSDLPQLEGSDDEPSPPPVSLHPTLKVTSSAQIDEASLAQRATLTGSGDTVPLTAKLEVQPTPDPGSNAAQLFDPSLNDWVYDLVPSRDLHKATHYALNIAPGVEPAYGNVPTAKAFRGGIVTYDSLSVVPTTAPSSNPGGRFTNGDPVIAFNNPIDPKSVAAAITVSPAPAKVKTLATLDDDASIVDIDPYALDPDQTYTITVGSGIRDTFGQTLGQDRTVTVHTGDFAPGEWAPGGVNVIPAGLDVAVNFYATNLPNNRYQSAYLRVPPEQLLNTPDPASMLPPHAQWGMHVLSGARKNAQSTVRIPLQSALNGPFGTLAYGFRSDLDASDQTGQTGIVQLTNLGVFAQWFPERGIVFTQHLSDGAPAPHVAVTVYRNVDYNSTGPPQQCAIGTSDARGELDFQGIDVERCYAGTQNNNSPSVAIVAAEGSDVATLQTKSYSGIGRFNVYSGWLGGAPLSLGVAFTDRQMYQPGERGQITGVAYYASANRIVADRNAVYKVTLTDPSNNVTNLGNATTDAYGIFSLPLTLSKQQALGYYTVNAKGPNGNDINGTLRVAEFKPPNFKLSLTVTPATVAAGGSAQASADAAYLFGAPLQGGTAHAYVTRDVAVISPKDRDDYWFGRQWFWPEQTPSFGTDVLQQDLPIDAQGKVGLNVPVPDDLPFPMTYTVDMETTDVSNLSVSDSQTFLALPADAVIGLASDTVGAAGSPMTIRSIVTNADGTAISGRSVHYELQKMTYTAATQAVEGGQDAQQAVRYDTVGTADATSGDGEVTVSLTPPDAGAYRVRANFAGAKSDASETDMQVFAFGAGQADWGTTDANAVAVKLDKKSYAIGDTATALVASPFDHADVYVMVERGDTLYRTELRNVSGAVRVPFKIASDMLPNAAFEAVVVRRGANLSSIKPGSLDTLSRTGVAGFSVDVADRYLKLGIAPAAATVTPGGSQRVTFSLARKDGTATQGEIVAMVVNDAILQLSGYRLPDLVTTVFAQQPISTIFSDNRENVILKTQTAPLEKGFGYGGGYLAGAAGTRVRQHFLPMAYYGIVKTGSDGKATMSFTMPDDLTTWRVMAIAVGNDDAHFVTNDATFISTQPLITNPLLPQFARTGDAFGAGVSVSNQTGSNGTLDVVAALSGALSFAQGDRTSQSTSQPATAGIAALRFPVIAGTPAPTTFQVATKLGTNGDAFKVPFTVTNRATTDSVIESGAARPAAPASIPVSLDRGGWVQLTLANSIVPQFAVPSNDMMTQDALPLADEAASRLTVASALQQLKGPYRLTLGFDPAAESKANLQRLLGFQKPDGDFVEYTSAKGTDPFVTAFALEALAFARARGVDVDAGVISRAVNFMHGALADTGTTCGDSNLCRNQLRFEILWALAQNGERRTDFLSDIVAQSHDFDSATRIRLARYLLMTPGWQSQGAAMADQLTQTLYVTGRYAVANANTQWGWMGDLVDAQAQMLQLLLERHAAVEQVDGAVRALIAQQCRCGWPTMDATASAIAALSEYAATEHLGPAGASVSVGSATVANARFGSTASSQTFTLAAGTLHGSTIDIHADGGTAHYTVLYTYDVPAESPGELAAFRVVRTVSRPGATAAPLATMDLAALSSPVELTAGNVFDVGVRVIVDHPVDRLVIEDPLPAGLEAVDTSFRTTLQAIVPQSDSWDIGTQQIYSDRVVAYAEHLGPGIYDVHYLARSVTPGTFRWPGAHAYLHDAPEEFGRSASTTLHITP